MSKLSNLKSRLMLLVLIALAPVVLLILYSDLRHRHSIETDIRNDLASLNLLAKDNLNKFFDATNLLLITFSQTAEVRKGSHASISAFFRNLLKNYPDYANIGMADLRGNLVCSALPVTRQINSSGLFWFQQAVRTRDFSIGEYQIGRIAGMPVLVLSRPVFDEAGKMKAVLYLSVKLDWLKRLVTDVKLPEGYTFVITDRKGTVLSRHPEPEKWTGKLLQEAPLISALLSQKNGVAEIAGLDGVQRMYVFSTVGYGENYIYLAVGMSKEAAFKESRQILLFDLLLLIVVGGAGLAIAHIFSNAVILRPVNALKNAAGNLSRGDFSARTGFAGRTDELGSLAGIFDSMAQAVQDEMDVRKKTEDALAESVEYNRMLFEQTRIGLVLCRMDGSLVDVNPAYAAIIGRTVEETLALTYWEITPQDYAGHEQAQLELLGTTGRYGPYEKEYIHQDGHCVPVRLQGLIIERQGEKFIWSSVEDITERKRVEEMLKRNERVLRLFVEYSPAAIAMFDRDMKYIVASRCFLMDYELGDQNVIGRSHYEVFPEISERWKEIHRRCLTGAVEKCEEDPFPRADGRMDWVRWEIHPWYETEGEIGGIILFSEVITGRKQAEEEIRTINEELVAINRIITAITGVSNMNEILERVLDETLGITGLEGGTICMLTPENTLQLASHRETSEATILDLTANEIKVGDCLCGECAHDHKPLILWDREAVLKFATREATRGEDIRFHAAFPLITGGKCLGVLCVFTRTDKKPEERRLKRLETVTAQIALAVQNAGLFEETLRNAAILEDRVKERTAELEEKIAEIERMNRLFVGRELRMKELKERIKELEKKSG